MMECRISSFRFFNSGRSRDHRRRSFEQADLQDAVRRQAEGVRAQAAVGRQDLLGLLGRPRRLQRLEGKERLEILHATVRFKIIFC